MRTEAIDAAHRAFESWRLVPAPKRAEILFKAAPIIAERKEQFARDMTREMGKVLDETRGDVQEAIDMTYFLAAEGRRLHGQTAPSELRDKFAMSMRQPIGVCSMITPWNFPMAIPSWKIIPALVCGNTVVLKPSELTPLSALHFVKVLEEAGVPPGVVNMVTGGPAVGEALTTHPRVVGGVVHRLDSGRQAGQPERRAALQEGPPRDGRQEPHHDHGRCEPRAGVGGLLVGRLRHDRAALHGREPHHRPREGARSIRRPPSWREYRRCASATASTRRRRSGPSISEKQLQKVMSYVEIGQQEGATLACGGKRLTGGAHAKGFFHEPTVFTDVTRTMRIAREEIFGPVVSVIKCGSLDEAIAIGNDVDYGLSASIYTQDINRAFRAMRDMYTGIFYVNAPTIGAEVHLPFGGTKATGNGHREAGLAALDVFSEWKSVYVDFSGKLQRAQIDNAE